MTRKTGMDDRQRAKRIAYKYIAYRERSREETANHLSRKEIPEAVIARTLDELTALNYLNDDRFAANWGRLRIDNKKFGKIRVLEELIDKGLNPQLAGKILDEVYLDVDESHLAEISAKKKLAQINDPDTKIKRRRIAQFLQRRGFDSDVIAQTLERLIPY